MNALEAAMCQSAPMYPVSAQSPRYRVNADTTAEVLHTPRGYVPALRIEDGEPVEIVGAHPRGSVYAADAVLFLLARKHGWEEVTR
jgi:hypothetical protein